MVLWGKVFGFQEWLSHLNVPMPGRFQEDIGWEHISGFSWAGGVKVVNNYTEMKKAISSRLSLLKISASQDISCMPRPLSPMLKVVPEILILLNYEYKQFYF